MADYDIEPKGNSVLRALHADNPGLSQQFRTLTISAAESEPPCRQSPELWWDDDKEAQKLAVDGCSRCPLKTQCFQWSIDAREREGVWGGVTPKERAKILSKLNKENKAKRAEAKQQSQREQEEASLKLKRVRLAAKRRAAAILEKASGAEKQEMSAANTRAVIAERRRNSRNWGKGIQE